MTTLSNDFINVSISHATLRTEDLIPTIMDFIREHAPAEYRKLPANMRRVSNWNSYVHHHPEECSDFLNEDLFNAMDAIAPEGTIFSSNEGDGSDFGFWKYEDEEEYP